MEYWLGIISDYQSVYISLCQAKKVVQTVGCDKNDSNKRLLTLIDQLLSNYNLTLNDLVYIGVNLGPGPYTSLRIAITTANALSFAKKIPLIGIDSMLGIIDEHQTKTNLPIMALFNAFNNEVFYAIDHRQTPLISGCASIETFIEIAKQSITGPVYVIGNGALLHYNTLCEHIALTQQPTEIPVYVSLDYILEQCWQTWQKGEASRYELFPLYLKKLQYKNSILVNT